MERLTIDEIIEHCVRKTGMYEEVCDVKYLETEVMNNAIKEYWEHKQVAEYLKKFKEYEDLEEQGLLLRLPCGIGTIVYEVENNADACSECSDFERGYCCDDWCGNKNVHDEDGDIYVSNPQYADKHLCKKHFYEVNEYTMSNVDEIFNMRKAFGKTVFLNKEEAEAKLEELRGENNGSME